MPHSSKHSRHPGHVKSYPFASPQRLDVESALGLWCWSLVAGEEWKSGVLCCRFASWCLREVSHLLWCCVLVHSCLSPCLLLLFTPHHSWSACHFCSGIKTPQCLPNRRWSLSDYFPGLGFQYIKRSRWMGMQLGELCESLGWGAGLILSLHLGSREILFLNSC